MSEPYRTLEDELGDVVGKARRGQELSVDELSQSTGISRAEINAIEAYETPEDTHSVQALASALGLEASKLEGSSTASFFPADPHPAEERSAGLEVHMLVLGTDFLMNGYVAVCRRTRKAAVIDPGFQAERILQVVAAAHAEVDTVWLTHGHYDHVSALGEILRATGAGASICAADLEIAEDVAASIGQRLIPGGQVRVGEQSFDVRATGGHTPGGVSLIHAEGTAFVGDALFAGSLGGTRKRSGYEGQRSAVKRELLSLPTNTTLYPGHGPATTVAEELAHNPFFI